MGTRIVFRFTQKPSLLICTYVCNFILLRRCRTESVLTVIRSELARWTEKLKLICAQPRPAAKTATTTPAAAVVAAATAEAAAAVAGAPTVVAQK